MRRDGSALPGQEREALEVERHAFPNPFLHFLEIAMVYASDADGLLDQLLPARIHDVDIEGPFGILRNGRLGRVAIADPR